MGRALWFWQLALLVALFSVWQCLTQRDLLPPVFWDNPHRAPFFFGEPVKMFKVVWDCCSGSGSDSRPPPRPSSPPT